MRKSGKLGKSRRLRRKRRHARIRKKVHGTGDRPRLVVHRSLRNIQGQVVDDDVGRTLVGLSTLSPALREAGAGANGGEAGAGENGAGANGAGANGGEAGAGANGGGAGAGKAEASGKGSEAGAGQASGKVGAARAAGRMLAEQARARGVVRVVFDRGGFRYHGRVKAFAEGAREGGLEF